MTYVDDKKSPPQFDLPTYSIEPLKKMMHSGLCGNYHIHCDPFLGVGRQAVRIITCFCEYCIDTIKSEWVEGKKLAEHPRFQKNVHFKYASVF